MLFFVSTLQHKLNEFINILILVLLQEQGNKLQNVEIFVMSYLTEQLHKRTWDRNRFNLVWITKDRKRVF
jgi:hypothetical protein